MTESLQEPKHGDVLFCCIVTFLSHRVVDPGFERGCEIARRTVLRIADGALRWRRCRSRGRPSFHDWAWTGRASRGSSRRDPPSGLRGYSGAFQKGRPIPPMGALRPWSAAGHDRVSDRPDLSPLWTQAHPRHGSGTLGRVDPGKVPQGAVSGRLMSFPLRKGSVIMRSECPHAGSLFFWNASGQRDEASRERIPFDSSATPD